MILVSWKYINQVYWSTISCTAGQENFREQAATKSEIGIIVKYALMEMSFQDVVFFKQPEDSH